MPTTDDYVGLVTSEHADKPNFTAMISLDVSPLVRVQDLMTSMNPLFDVDIATGNQLDIIGKWAGISRNVTIPLPDVYFTWDDTDATGWDFGIWQGNTPGTITVLPDDVYRTFVKAKIAANQWDGTTTGAYEIWDSVFTDLTILIFDNQDMTYDLAIVGGIIDSLTLALITGGYIPLKPEAIRVNTYYIPGGGGPIFGWDIETSGLQGWDEGSWAKVITPT